MKVILSRKGFDSSAGGYPSAIMPDGTLISFPIPDDNGVKTCIQYKDMNIDDGLTYQDLMEQLGIKNHNETQVHLDPDLYPGIIKRNDGWKPVLGQSHAAQKHLSNNNIEMGDLFLFFGWFRKVQLVNNVYKYVPETDRHVIWGYLQVGEIIKIDQTKEYDEWLEGHPHFKYRKRENNTAYIASEKLSFDNRINGAGVLNFHESLILTHGGQENRSFWSLPKFLHPDYGTKMTYHENRNRWNIDGQRCTLQSVGRGQEFVVTGNTQIEEWAKSVILYNCTEKKLLTRNEIAFGRLLDRIEEERIKDVPPKPANNKILKNNELLNLNSNIDALIDSFITTNQNNKAFYNDTDWHNQAVINLNNMVFKDIENLTIENFKKALENNVLMKLPNKNKVFDTIDNNFERVRIILRLIKDFDRDPIGRLSKLLNKPNFHINGGGIFFITQLLAGAHPNEYIVLEENMIEGLKDLGIIDSKAKFDTPYGYLYINKICRELYEMKFRNKVSKFNFGLASVHNFFWHYHAHYKLDKKWL